MDNCVFCKIINGEFSCYKLYEDDIVLAFLSIDPVSYGHTLIIPKKHILDYEEIDLETLNHINKVGKDIYNKLKEKLNPDSIKLVQNNGKLQEVKHFHLHLIPFFDKNKERKENLEEVLKNIIE